MAGLALFFVTVGKVFLIDLAGLDVLYRLIAFAVLGVFLLLGLRILEKSGRVPQAGVSDLRCRNERPAGGLALAALCAYAVAGERSCDESPFRFATPVTPAGAVPDRGELGAVTLPPEAYAAVRGDWRTFAWSGREAAGPYPAWSLWRGRNVIRRCGIRSASV
jgi:hypothetical protein